MIQIGKDKFEVKRPYGMRSFAMLQRILPIAGNVIGAIAHVAGATLNGEIDVQKLLSADVMKVLPVVMPVLSSIFERMPSGELESVARILLGDPKKGGPEGSTTINGAPLFEVGGDAFDLLMQGRNLDTARLLLHAVEVWYPDFFALVRPFIATEKKAPLSAESTTSPQPGPASA